MGEFQHKKIKDCPNEEWTPRKEIIKSFILFLLCILILGFGLLYTFNYISGFATDETDVSLLHDSGEDLAYLVASSVAIPDPCTLSVISCAQSGVEQLEVSRVGIPPADSAILEVTAYNTVEWQADETPCIAASGLNICTNSPNLYNADYFVASNDHEFYTLLEIEGLGTGVVVDRLNSRYSGRIDICMGQDIERAINFGIKELKTKEVY